MSHSFAIAASLLALATSPADPAPPAAAPPAAALQEGEGPSFSERFRRALKAKDAEAMKLLVAENQLPAAEALTAVCEQIAEGTNERLEREAEAYREAWRAAFDTGFADAQYEYFALMRADYRASRDELKSGFQRDVKLFQESVENQNKGAIGGLGSTFEGYAKGFVELGDRFFASKAWMLAGECFDETHRGEEADLRSAYVAYREAIDAREAIGLSDGRLEEVKARWKVLDEAGLGDPTKEIVGGLASKAKKAGAALELDMAFEPVEVIDAVARPLYTADENYQIWPTLNFGGNGSSTGFSGMEHSPNFLRAGAADVRVDVDGDGTGEVEVPLTGNLELVQLSLGEGEEKRSWAFLAAIGQTRDRFQGFDFNLEPTPDYMSIYIAPAASLVGMLGDTPIRVFDDNMDGIYGSGPVYWAHIGLAGESLQVDLDAIQVGKERSARPWSEYQQIGDSWYRFERNETGTEIKATPVTIPTGRLELSFKGGKPDYVVVRGTGKYQEAFFDLTQGGSKGVEVPVGKYRLLTGRFSKGKRRQMSKALMVAPQTMAAWEVKEGESVEAELGAPFQFDFDVRQDDESVTVVGSSVVVTGAGGERYERLWNCVVHPEASIRKEGSRKGSKGEKMRPAASQMEIIDNNNDQTVAWFPFDVRIPKKSAGEAVEVQLFEKKNGLFGKIESEWKN